jgi:hypothetical protein
MNERAKQSGKSQTHLVYINKGTIHFNAFSVALHKKTSNLLDISVVLASINLVIFSQNPQADRKAFSYLNI